MSTSEEPSDVETALDAAEAWWRDPNDQPGDPRRVAIELADEVRRLQARIKAGAVPPPHPLERRPLRVLVLGYDYRSSGTAYAAADLVVDRTGRVLKWRYGPREATR